MKKILLVEPAYPARFAPLGLMKISTYQKSLGNEVSFVKGRCELDFIPDEIYITSLFTFWYKKTIQTILFYKTKFPKSKLHVGGIFASLMPEFIERHTGVKPYFGLIPEVEKCLPDYTLCESEYSMVFTSRGCIRGCKFCVVPKLEGKMKNVPNWQEAVDLTKSKITFMDNNWFAKAKNDFDNDIKLIKKLLTKGIKEIDFNQGLDARLFTEEMAKKLEGIPFRPIRFSFDNMSEDKYIQRATELCKKYGFTRNEKWDSGAGSLVLIYVLYNFNDTPENYYYRMRECVKSGATPFPMRFSPHTDLQRKYIGKHWTKEQRNAVDKMQRRTGGANGIIVDSREEFEFFYGKDEKEFVALISDPNAPKKYLNKISIWRRKRIKETMGY